jgi:rRNA processing protein Krr1/Pno1
MEENKEVTKKVENAQDNYIDERVEKVTKEAVETINLVSEVITLLDKKEKEKAIEKIAEVLGKLEVLVARDPNLQLVPVDVKESVVDFPGTVEDIKVAKEEVVKLIKNSDLQKARDIMLNLASELDIFVTALPIGTYPVALKAIVRLSNKKNLKTRKNFWLKLLKRW